MDKILCIIVTYNGIQWIKRCLDSIKNSSVHIDAFIIDNGSSDGTIQFVKDNYSYIYLLENKENVGFGKANNIGFEYAIKNNYDYIYLLNQDAWLLQDTVEKMIDIYNRNTKYSILSPFQMSANLKKIDFQFWANLNSAVSFRCLMNDLYNNEPKEVYPVDFVMAAHWFMPIKTLKEIGGFSPTFPHYGEDSNYIDRIKYKKGLIGIVPSLKVVHDRSERVVDNDKKIYFGYTTSLKELSNPNMTLIRAIFRNIIIVFYGIIKYKSIKPVLYLFRIIISLKQIVYNKKISIENKCAFLNL